MNREDELERLFSRYLDGESTAQERQQLHTLLRRDPAVRGAFEECRDLDAAVGDALRADLGLPRRALPWYGVRIRLATGLTLAAAACIALFVWLRPPGPGSGVSPGGEKAVQATMGPSWFVPQGPRGDEFSAAPAAYQRPELRVRDTRRHWLVVPTREPGRYLIIEVDHMRTRAVGVHQDF